MNTSLLRRLGRRTAVLATIAGIGFGSSFATAAPASATDYARIQGSGSSWAANAIQNWTANGSKYGWQVTYSDTGSSKGRTDFLNHTVDFAVSDIPFQARPTDGSAVESPTPGSYAYMPIVAGGTAFMYHLTIGGKQVTNLRLSGQNIAKIFTGQLQMWNDPAIAADNPGLTLPAVKIVPVVRSDGSGSSAQFSLWMDNQYPDLWRSYYKPGGETSYWPIGSNMKGQSLDSGVAAYVAASYGEGAIGYVQYSYAKNAKFPVVKMLNKAGYYVEPTDQNVAVALTHAQIETQNHDPAVYLTQKLEGVYNDTDPRTYPMSAYSYMILPTSQSGVLKIDPSKAQTLGAFGKYLLCQGQQGIGQLGYSPLPINLVQAGFDQLKTVPGVNVGDLSISSCNNPTFSPDGQNLLAKNAPMPPACDKQGPTQCSTGTGGATQSTKVKPAAAGTGSASGSGSGTGSGSSGTGTGAGGTSASGSTEIDPNTGLPVDGSGGSGGSADVPVAGPVSLNKNLSSGWGGSQSLAVIAGLLVVAVFVAPPLLVSRMSRKNKADS